MILYRGVNEEFHRKFDGRLMPKESGPFRKPAEYGRSEYGNSYYGNNEQNAVVEHQLHQAGYATSGISTTPNIERAKFYATRGGKWESYFVYEIDTADCERLEVQIFVVSSFVPSPEIPVDEEVILVAKEFGELPKEIISNVHEFGT